ncbi:hypothetical protein RchiOBHm_Chr4g0412211 [Rosa chinensis]|uniref:Uncharacterized protein n=1 Tax=Rosa chinensis TaxID=74649 RepID=A0A2P6QVR7_ROSCH|nr:hypothetical protein RchiOBHm_Chr4g0412211 [Rosa chinensis]
MFWCVTRLFKGWCLLSQSLCAMEEVVKNFARILALAETKVEVIMPPTTLEEEHRRWFLIGILLMAKPYMVGSLISMIRSLWIPKSEAPGSTTDHSVSIEWK